MGPTAKFYRVEKPFQYLIQVGHKWSNTWIGRSRASEFVLDPNDAYPGEITFYDLPGGLFACDLDHFGYRARLTHPRPLLEKNYGPNPEFQRLSQLIRDGYLVETEKPENATREHYQAWAAYSDKMLTDA